MLGLGSDEDMVRTDADVSSYGYLRLGVICFAIFGKYVIKRVNFLTQKNEHLKLPILKQICLLLVGVNLTYLTVCMRVMSENHQLSNNLQLDH